MPYGPKCKRSYLHCRWISDIGQQESYDIKIFSIDSFGEQIVFSLTATWGQDRFGNVRKDKDDVLFRLRTEVEKGPGEKDRMGYGGIFHMIMEVCKGRAHGLRN